MKKLILRIKTISISERLDIEERALITWALVESKGNKSRAAKALSVKRTTLVEKMRRHGMPLNPCNKKAVTV